MRATLLAAVALVAAPATAQDHSAHEHHPSPVHAPAQEETPAPEVDHSAMDHGAMDHEPAPAADHSKMDHGAIGHEPAPAADHETMDHAAMGHGGAPPPASGPPPRAFEGPEHAADTIFGTAAMAPSRAAVARENGGFTGSAVMLERLEARLASGEDLYLWDAQGWYGGDIDKLFVKSEGEGAFGGAVEHAEVQALWSHAIDPWFDLQAGARYDFEPQGRAHAVLGLQGLAPYMFEIDAAAFLSDRGDLTGRIEAEYDQRITQRLILQPRIELSAAAQDTPDIGIGAGLTALEAGLRLRYEIVREFAPYVGIGYEAKLGRTADFARAAGEDPDGFALLLGLRAWF